jgi:hypothetical protein
VRTSTSGETRATNLVFKILYITPVGAPQRVDEPSPGNCPF